MTSARGALASALLVGAGGFVGSIARYLVSGWAHRVAPFARFPVGTLAVNGAGCLLIGFLLGLAEAREALTPNGRLFLVIGILGGFTTFSAFGFETVALLRDGERSLALANIGLSLGVGLAAVWAGQAAARLA